MATTTTTIASNTTIATIAESMGIIHAPAPVTQVTNATSVPQDTKMMRHGTTTKADPNLTSQNDNQGTHMLISYLVNLVTELICAPTAIV